MSRQFQFKFVEEILLMMAPHWLDDVFESPDTAVQTLLASGRFKAAVAKAQAAFHEAQDFLKKNPGVVGGSPAQQARVAFLEAVEAD
jgi:hypothetical protein